LATYKHFELYPEKTNTRRFSKITVNLKGCFEKSGLLSDLDIVNHKNNVKYLEWCLDHVDEINQKLNSFEMNFMKELSLNDNVVIHENLSEESTTFSITKENKTALC
jgi:acyl-ACP thioesterase